MTEHQILDHFSQPAAGNPALQKILEGRADALQSIPTVAATLQSLLKELEQPAEEVNLVRLAELIGRDESLSAQCLRLANSVRFSPAKRADSLIGAVRILGLSHIRDVVTSSSVMRIASTQNALNPLTFWKHSLGSAIMSRKLARVVGLDDPEKAYLAGLLHDLGYIVNMVLAPQKTAAVIKSALRQGVFLGESEFEQLGFTHCQSGELLARSWRFPDDIVEVVLCHHNPSAAVLNPALVATVALSDRLCRSNELGLGYAENPDPASEWQADWAILAERCPMAERVGWAAFVKDAGAYFAEIRDLVAALYTGPA